MPPANSIGFDRGHYLAECNGNSFIVDERFLAAPLDHLEKMLECGVVRYLFRLDSFQSHPFVPASRFNTEYRGLTAIEMAKKYVVDPSLGALYHNAEHFALGASTRDGKIARQSRELIEKRNVIGWYDGRGIEVMDPRKADLVGICKSNTASIPRGYSPVGSIVFKAHTNGTSSFTRAAGRFVSI